MAHRTVARAGEDYAFEDEQGEHWGARLLREVLEIAVMTLLLFVAVRLLVQNYQVVGPSMEPTLQNHQYILVDKALYYLHAPQRGDVIVFAYPKDTSVDYVKRIIGIPGDTVVISANGAVVVDGVPLHEPYISAEVNPYGAQTWHVGPDQYFVLGDHRDNSSDSRAWGLVPRGDIIGEAALVYWPLPTFHLLPTYGNVFAGVHS